MRQQLATTTSFRLALEEEEAATEGSSQTSGTIPGTPVGGFHHAEVRYDTASRLGVVLLNGVQVFSQTLAADPDIQYAGFHMAGATQGATKLDDFQVVTLTPGVTVLISDSFSATGPLDGRQAEVGGVTWDASVAALLNGDVVLDETAIGGLPFDPLALPGNPTVAVAAAVDPSASTSVSVGFSSLAGFHMIGAAQGGGKIDDFQVLATSAP